MSKHKDDYEPGPRYHPSVRPTVHSAPKEVSPVVHSVPKVDVPSVVAAAAVPTPEEKAAAKKAMGQRVRNLFASNPVASDDEIVKVIGDWQP
jgi:hypothetical protein